MSYRTEFRTNWRHLLGATVGMSLGLSLNFYVNSLFAPELIAEFGWSKSQYALIGSASLITMFFIPLGGRFIDVVGPRLAAAVGFTVLPLCDIALTFMTGDFRQFFAISIIRTIFGVFTTTMVFARVASERFDTARGIALSIVMTGAPIVGALLTPFLAEIIGDYGWRAGYRALALIAALGGGAALLLLGRGPKTKAKAPGRPRVRFAGADIAALFRSPLFPLAFGGMLLVNVPQVVAASQLKLILLQKGVATEVVTGVIALYAGGVAVGRILSGLALDRIAAHKVAIAVLGFPALGLLALASPLNAAWLLGGSVLLLALAQGAEGDIGAYLVSRKFPLKDYSLLLSLMTIAITIGSALGSLVLSYFLHETDTYTVFLVVGAVATLVGAILFYLTGRYPPAGGEAAEPEIPMMAGLPSTPAP